MKGRTKLIKLDRATIERIGEHAIGQYQCPNADEIEVSSEVYEKLHSLAREKSCTVQDVIRRLVF